MFALLMSYDILRSLLEIKHLLFYFCLFPLQHAAILSLPSALVKRQAYWHLISCFTLSHERPFFNVKCVRMVITDRYQPEQIILTVL